MIDRISSPVGGVSAVKEAGPAFLDAVKPAEAAAIPEEFSSMISQMIAETADALHKAEATSVAAVHGQATTQQVVEKVMAAEQSLQAAIAVRDKVTAAYLELSRMAV